MNIYKILYASMQCPMQYYVMWIYRNTDRHRGFIREPVGKLYLNVNSKI